MSTPNPGSPPKRKLLKDSPFQKLTQRTTDTGEQAMREAREIDITKIEPNSRNPRRTFDEVKLNELAEDIRARGILQPPIVRSIPDTDHYEIVVGERRYQAAKLARRERIPVIVRDDLDDEQAEIVSLVENIQREDLTIEDEVNYFKMLKTKYGYSMRDIAENVAHKSHTYVELRLKLSEQPHVLKALQDGKIRMSEAAKFLRMKLGPKALNDQIERLISLQTSQSVNSVDRLLDKSQSVNSVDKKPPPEPNEIDRRLAQPFLKIAHDIHVAVQKLEGVELKETTAILESLAILESEIRELRKRLMGDLN